MTRNQNATIMVAMASITLKDIPSPLHRALKARAKSHNRSMNQEVIAVLTEAVNPSARRRMDALLAEAQRFRGTLAFAVKPGEVERFKRQGCE